MDSQEQADPQASAQLLHPRYPQPQAPSTPPITATEDGERDPTRTEEHVSPFLQPVSKQKTLSGPQSQRVGVVAGLTAAECVTQIIR